MHRRVEAQHTIAQGVAPAKIVKQPPVNGALLSERLLNGADSLLMCRDHDERHHIVALPRRQ